MSETDPPIEEQPPGYDVLDGIVIPANNGPLIIRERYDYLYLAFASLHQRLTEAEQKAEDAERTFPICQPSSGEAPSPRQIPWSMAEKAYKVYAEQYAASQSLEQLAHRGGFHPGEMDRLYPSWRNEVDEVVKLKKSLAAAEDALSAAQAERERLEAMLGRWMSAAVRLQTESMAGADTPEDRQRFRSAVTDVLDCIEPTDALAERDKAIAERGRIAEANLPVDSPTWPYVLAFALRMEAKLAKNRHKGDRKRWLKDSFYDLYRRVEQESAELAGALAKDNPQDVMDEAADVANMAMMTADSFAPGILTRAAALASAAEEGERDDDMVVRVTVDGRVGTARAKNKRDLDHVCGLHGFGYDPNDRCPRCELDNEAAKNAVAGAGGRGDAEDKNH